MTRVSEETSAAGKGQPPTLYGDGRLAKIIAGIVSDLRSLADATCIVPTVPEAGSMSGMSDQRLNTEVGDALNDVLTWVQRSLEDTSDDRRVIFVLPSVPLMGAADCVGASAVSNGVLSMARTLSIELARDHICVNVLAVDVHGLVEEAELARDTERVTGLHEALAGQLATLFGASGRSITGQEIYVTAGNDLGRLRP
jgi:hypothetical protein